MGGQPSAEGAPDEQQGGGSEVHEHETTSARTAEAENGGKPSNPKSIRL